MRIRNFLFHRVNTEKDAMWPPMQPELFARILRQLTRDFTIVPLEYYLDDPGSFPTKKKIATILFDDGYKDNIEYAAPILKQHGCPASFYITTDCIDRNIPTWTFIFDNTISKTKTEKLEFSFDFVPEKFRLIPVKINNSNNPVFIRELKPWMKKLSNPQRLDIMRSLMNQCPDTPVPENKMMNWDDIRQLKTDGFIIGSHSHTHPCLSALHDVSEIKEELRISGDKIQRETGKFPETISYPMNNFDDRVTRLAKETGYKYGLAVGERFYKPGKDNNYRIPRSELHEEPWWKIKIRINGMYSLVKKIWP